MKLINNQNRGVLNEGRNYGVGFAFAKKKGDDFEAVMPISPCKDYLNDQLYSEITGKPYNACGFNSVKSGCITDCAYLAFSSCHYHSGMPYGKFAAQIEYLEKSLSKVQSFLNQLEEVAGCERSILTRIDRNEYVTKVPLFWVQATYLISLYSLFIRFCVESEYQKGDPIEKMADAATNDKYLLKEALPKLKTILQNKHPKQDFSVPFSVHSMGIKGFRF